MTSEGKHAPKKRARGKNRTSPATRHHPSPARPLWLQEARFAYDTLGRCFELAERAADARAADTPEIRTAQHFVRRFRDSFFRVKKSNTTLLELVFRVAHLVNRVPTLAASPDEVARRFAPILAAEVSSEVDQSALAEKLSKLIVEWMRDTPRTGVPKWKLAADVYNVLVPEKTISGAQARSVWQKMKKTVDEV